MKTDNKLFAQAFAYAVNGYSVMPLRLDKKPLLATWKKYQDRPATEDEITKWWADKPTANIGIITGKVSGIIVVDIDTKGGLQEKHLKTFPPTFTVKTPTGGYHLYYLHAEGFTISANAYPQYPGVDLRADGGFVVAPPSHCEYKKDGHEIKGDYTVIKKGKLAPFPVKLFAAGKQHKKLGSLLEAGPGKRNDNIASFIGKLLRSAPEKEWGSDVWPAVQTANKTYKPPLSDRELKTTFDSIVKKEKGRLKGLVLSPFQVEGKEVEIPLRRNSNGGLIKDMANAMAVLEFHPYYKGTIRYNEFRQEIEYKGKVLEDSHLVKMQYFMQKTIGLSGISKEAVMAAAQHYASQNSYDEAKDWVQSLKWDKKPRLKTWVSRATGVEQGDYHAGIGSQWFLGLIKRIMEPGCIFDHCLVMIGSQGIGKTSLFRIIGGPWYKNYTGAMDNKDFFLALRGAVIVDLDEGASLYRSDAIKIKSIITNTHDEFRAPYDRLMKKYPRRFVFSMSTNDTEPFKDVTGNRRYWTIDGEEKIDFKWLEKNREQLYAEAEYHRKNKIALPEVPEKEALERQEAHLPGDSWADIAVKTLRRHDSYCKGDSDFSITVAEIYSQMFPQAMLEHLGKSQEMRLAAILKKECGMERRRKMIEGQQGMRWVLQPKRAAELKANNLELNEDFKGL